MKKTKEKNKYWKKLIRKVIIIIVIILFISLFIKIKAVHSNEMFPSIRDGDLIVATTLIKPSYNSVVIYETVDSQGNKEQHLGRIMSLENNIIDIDDKGNLKINESIISENNFYQDYEKGDITYPYYVNKDNFFILEDYRPEITDSRIYGGINKKQIIGTVIFDFRIRGF